MTKRLGLAVLSAVVLGGAALFWFSGDRAQEASRPSPPEAPARGCAFTHRERAAFRLETIAEARGTSGEVPTDRFKAVLSWEVLDEPTPGEWLVRAAFSSTELVQQLSQPDQRLTQPLDAPFVLRIRRDCRFSEKGYSRDWDPVTRRFVSSVLGSFEFAVAPADGGTSWELEQADGLGRYAARYDSTPLPGGTLALTRVKARYRDEDRALGLGFQIQLVHAKATAILAPSGAWLERASGLEQVRIKAQGSLLADLEQRYTLTRDDAAFVPLAAGPEQARLDWQDPFLMPTRTTAVVDPVLVQLSIDGALKRFLELYRKTPKGDAYAAARFLSDWLRHHPDQASTLFERLRAGGIPDELRPATFLALELCGTAEARAVLSGALSDQGLPEMDRARAASALSDVPEPTRESGRALIEASRNLESKLVSGSSVRALGHLVERAEKLNPELQSELRDALRAELVNAQDGSRSIDVVDAIGNTGDETFGHELTRRLADPAPAMREHAARAFRRMDSAQAAPSLVERLRVETDPAVRLALLETLLALGVRDPAALTLAAEQLTREPTPVVRAALIRWLGAAADLPIARAALIAHFRREQVPQLLQLIGRYVTADELK